MDDSFTYRTTLPQGPRVEPWLVKGAVVLVKMEQVLGPEHPNTLGTAQAAAACLGNMGEYAAAWERFKHNPLHLLSS